MITLKRITSFLSVVVAFHATPTTAVTYDVSATSDGMSLTEALELAQPGDSIYLADGTYDEAVVSYRDGEVDNPITIEGSSGAIINGDYSSRCILINHSFITLRVSQQLTIVSSAQTAWNTLNKSDSLDNLQPVHTHTKYWEGPYESGSGYTVIVYK